ncbi:MAG TPA: heme-binding domain-containing protein [Bacteroidales bacterium]|nr:heme-binding domain-containing protein [Bacteroidales bacterium]
MKAVKIILLALAVIFIVIQFIPSGIPGNKPDDDKSITRTGLASDTVLILLKRSCFDCHSNQVRLPWYARVAPSSWFLAGHIQNGKSHLNFSEWEDYSRRKKIGLLEDVREEIESGGMPLKSYLIIHKDARLNTGEISALSEWTEKAASRILE